MRHFIGRRVRRTAVLVLFAIGVIPQGMAAKLRTHRITGVYLTHDEQVLQALARHTPGTHWIDGYKMTVSRQTRICWHDAPLQFGPILNRDGQPIPMLKATSPCESTPPVVLGSSAWLQYLGVQKYNNDLWSTPEMKVAATRIDVWNGESNGKRRLAPQLAAKPAWQALCASASPHELHYPNEGPIDVVCDAKVNSYIGSVFSALLKPSALTSESSVREQEIPSFYVVKPFEVRHNYDFERIDRNEADCAGGYPCTYRYPHAHSTVREIVYAPDGTVLIPDTALAHLENEAECAALLSYSLAASDQRLIERLFRVQHFKSNWFLSFWVAANRAYIYPFILTAVQNSWNGIGRILI